MLTDQQKQQLQQAMDLLHQADVLVQQAMGHSDECYYIHSQIENAADDVQDFMNTENEDATL
jgi:ABC-type transporter Mla subunit MlaD